MAKQIKPSRPGTKAIRHVVTKVPRETLKLMDQKDQTLSDESIHRIRSAMKRLWASIRLLRSEIGQKAYPKENLCFRNVGRRFRYLRDAKVLNDTFQELVASRERELELGPNLERSFNAVIDALAKAEVYSSSENFHEWRKKTKYLRYQLEILTPIYPHFVQKLAGC